VGWLSGNGKEGKWLEGRESHSHQHRDGSYGRDIEAYRVDYRGGQEVHSEKASDWGKGHTDEGSGK
jgi:hypothetical protein